MLFDYDKKFIITSLVKRPRIKLAVNLALRLTTASVDEGWIG